jgi:RNA polymerase sigma factor for flagellar operon FliA
MNAVAEPVECTDRLEFTDRAENFSAEERERLILEHLPQVRMLARKIHGRLPESVSLDDLVSTGILGLISAIDHFEPSRHVHLKTYAEHRIKGGILDSLRRLDWAPRQQRKHAKQIEAATAVTQQRFQRAPTEEEIAAELNLSIDRYHQWQVEIRGVNLGRLESAGSNSENRDLLRIVSDDASEWPSALFERKELQRTLAAAISEIPAVEKTVLSLYYQGELTLREIAEIVGLHESRISQLRTQAILRLRVSMATLWPAVGYRSTAAQATTPIRHSVQTC